MVTRLRNGTLELSGSLLVDGSQIGTLTVANLTERDAIITAARYVGLVVRLLNGRRFNLGVGLTNSDWIELANDGYEFQTFDTGTHTVYVSTSGDDFNDGYSPATAWRNPQRVYEVTSELSIAIIDVQCGIGTFTAPIGARPLATIRFWADRTAPTLTFTGTEDMSSSSGSNLRKERLSVGAHGGFTDVSHWVETVGGAQAYSAITSVTDELRSFSSVSILDLVAVHPRSTIFVSPEPAPIPGTSGFFMASTLQTRAAQRASFNGIDFDWGTSVIINLEYLILNGCRVRDAVRSLNGCSLQSIVFDGAVNLSAIPNGSIDFNGILVEGSFTMKGYAGNAPRMIFRGAGAFFTGCSLQLAGQDDMEGSGVAYTLRDGTTFDFGTAPIFSDGGHTKWLELKRKSYANIAGTVDGYVTSSPAVDIDTSSGVEGILGHTLVAVPSGDDVKVGVNVVVTYAVAGASGGTNDFTVAGSKGCVANA